MKFASFIYNNKNTWGIVKDSQLVSVDEAILKEVPTLRSAISQEKFGSRPKFSKKAWNNCSNQAMCLPVLRIQKILYVGLNYHEHRLEGGHMVGNINFCEICKCPNWSQYPNDQTKRSDTLDFEAELAVIIGTGGVGSLRTMPSVT